MGAMESGSHGVEPPYAFYLVQLSCQSQIISYKEIMVMQFRRRGFVKWAWISLCGCASLLQGQDDESRVFELESLTVVGSRIEAVDINTPSPVAVFSRMAMDEMGYISLGDVVRNLSFNSGNTIGLEGAATGFSAGVSSINLRGLGNNNTLVLINGRRSSAGVPRQPVDPHSTASKQYSTLTVCRSRWWNRCRF